MDRIENLRRLYNELIEKIEPIQIANIVLKNTENIEELKNIIDAHLIEVVQLYSNYLEAIETAELKHIALKRLKSDFEIFREDSIKLFNWQRHSRSKRVQIKVLNISIDVDFLCWFEICRVIENLFDVLIFDYANKDLLELEFNLIGATQKKRKTKQELSLTQKQINLLFHSFRENKVITNKVTDVASGLSTMTGLGYNFYNQNLSNPLSEAKDSIPTDADFVKAVNSLQKSIDYLNDLKVKNGIK
tara:strand:+ start:75 stop:812 length:738 start_codon:yes stop_codon:yes gene_type:complete